MLNVSMRRSCHSWLDHCIKKFPPHFPEKYSYLKIYLVVLMPPEWLSLIYMMQSFEFYCPLTIVFWEAEFFLQTSLIKFLQNSFGISFWWNGNSINSFQLSLKVNFSMLNKTPFMIMLLDMLRQSISFAYCSFVKSFILDLNT